MKRRNITEKVHVINAQVNMNGLDVALEKATELAEKIQEVKTLADELTTCISELKLEVKL